MSCSDCKNFCYDEYWDGEEEITVLYCTKNKEHVGWNIHPCEQFERKET